MDVNTILPTSGTSRTDALGDAFGNFKADDFIKLLVTELSQQDPLQPMDNDKILSQINALNEVGSTQQLVKALNLLSIHQGIGAASNLIGKQITGKTPAGTVTGVVEKALVEDGRVFVAFGDVKLPVDDVIEIS